jgi:hypothetical protein
MARPHELKQCVDRSGRAYAVIAFSAVARIAQRFQPNTSPWRGRRCGAFIKLMTRFRHDLPVDARGLSWRDKIGVGWRCFDGHRRDWGRPR